ncbi:conserved hypothetical protein [Weissella viridescens]|nr:conserved hypothetical protein [Weissella viridescens]
MTKIIAHRGLSAIAPENTLRSFEPMLDYNLDWFETDVSITADGQLVLLHDDKVDRTTGHAGEITAMTYDDVMDADAGSWFGPESANTQLLMMDDLLTFVDESGMNLNLELKGVTGPNCSALADQLIAQLVPYLRMINEEVNLIISSFNPVMLFKMHAAAPELAYAVLYDKGQFLDDWQLVADACNARYIHIDKADATPENIAKIQDRGFEVNVYTVNSLDDVTTLSDYGVDGIFTDVANEIVAPKATAAIAV